MVRAGLTSGQPADIRSGLAGTGAWLRHKAPADAAVDTPAPPIITEQPISDALRIDIFVDPGLRNGDGHLPHAQDIGRTLGDANAAARGRTVFEGQGKCATCHVAPTFTEPGWNMHKGSEIGIDDFQADRSPDGMYRTAPLAGRLFWRTRGFYHDGRFATLMDVVNHYNSTMNLGLNGGQMNDLVEYLKSI